MKNLAFLLTMFVLVFIKPGIAQQPSPVKVNGGLLQGINEDGLTVYKGIPEWPAFSDANPVVMYFNKTPHTGPVPSAESLKTLDTYFTWRRTPEGESWAK
jgi:hypothetical protein